MTAFHQNDAPQARASAATMADSRLAPRPRATSHVPLTAAAAQTAENRFIRYAIVPSGTCEKAHVRIVWSG